MVYCTYTVWCRVKLSHQNYVALPNDIKRADRLTIMACSNASGKYKFPLILIEKAKNLQDKILNCDSYQLFISLKKTWMNSLIFKNYFIEVFVLGEKTYL